MLLDFPEIIFSRTSFVVADSILWLVHRDDNKSEYNYVDAQLQLTLIFTVGRRSIDYIVNVVSFS